MLSDKAYKRLKSMIDRAVGTYTLQYTTVTPESGGLGIPDTGDAATGWATIGTVTYAAGADDVNFAAYLRHRFEIKQNGAAFEATAIRIKTAPTGNAIDEIEVNPIPDLAPPLSNFIEITPTTGYTIVWDKNEGTYSTINSPAPAPVNDASTNRGAVAFGSSQLDFGVHFIRNVNDGLYGNAHSWIDHLGPPFVLLAHAALEPIEAAGVVERDVNLPGLFARAQQVCRGFE